MPLKIAHINRVIVDQGQPPNPGTGEILQGRRANPAAADQHDMRLRQGNLPDSADFGQHDMASETVQAVGR